MRVSAQKQEPTAKRQSASSTRPSRPFAGQARELQARLVIEVVEPRPDRSRDIALPHHGLHEAGPVAYDEKGDLAARPLVVKPTVNGDLLADMVGQVADEDVLSH